MLFVAGGNVTVITAATTKTRDVTFANCERLRVGSWEEGRGWRDGRVRGGAAKVERAAALTQLTADCFALVKLKVKLLL